ncbi:tumor necrosis factor receptor superfamily member 16 [Biomphalaria pfeifferi]|uniref:Tumor necrosis factor receptor superfamily member 16 n=1 Tax=Biomphalaria pfeifferi TaxID=112525 RepID=A0AAD8FCM5_BIOPF|nr:tumor necrosis factor receptor superfamily member 16 [Biomphalaria pfeifferi]
MLHSLTRFQNVPIVIVLHRLRLTKFSFSMRILLTTLLVFLTTHRYEAAKKISSVITAGPNNLPVQTCKKGKFFSDKRQECVTCKKCDLFSQEVQACSATSNTICVQCLSDTGDLSKKYNHPVCKLCKPCGAGEYVARPCNYEKMQKTKCKPCESGSFKVMTSFSPYCVPCTDCGNMIELEQCTSSRDTSCGQCKPGYFLDKSRYSCFPCRSCMDGEKARDECENGDPGKLCGGMVLRPPIKYPNYLAAQSIVNNVKTTLTTITTFSTTTAITATATTSTNAAFLLVSSVESRLHQWALLVAVVSLSLVFVAILVVCITFLGIKLRMLDRPAMPPEKRSSPTDNTFIVLHCKAASGSHLSNYFEKNPTANSLYSESIFSDDFAKRYYFVKN